MQPQIVAVERVADLADERLVGVEPRHLVLVLVGHQLEQAARDRLGEPALVGRALGLCRLRAVDPGAVARRPGRVLVVGEEGDAARDHLVERPRELERRTKGEANCPENAEGQSRAEDRRIRTTQPDEIERKHCAK